MDKKQHETTIVVNAQEQTVTTKEITFEQVVELEPVADLVHLRYVKVVQVPRP